MGVASSNLEKDITTWKEQYQKYAGLFSNKVLQSKAFKRERLKQLLAIEAKYNPQIADPSVIAFLRIEKRELQKEISRNWITLLIRRAVNRVQLYFKRKEFHKHQEIGLFETNVSLNKMGINNSKIDDFLANNQSKGTFIQTDQISPNQQVEYKLEFDRKRLEGHSITYTDRQNNIARSFRFDAERDNPMPVEMIAKLLAGRAVKENGHWLQMDFNDKTPDGNYRIVRCTQDQLDAGIMNALKGLPVREKFSPDELQRKMDELSKGNPIRTTLVSSIGDVQADIYANPRNISTISVFGKDGNVIDPFAMNKEKTPDKRITESKQQSKVNRSSIKITR